MKQSVLVAGLVVAAALAAARAPTIAASPPLGASPGAVPAPPPGASSKAAIAPPPRDASPETAAPRHDASPPPVTAPWHRRVPRRVARAPRAYPRRLTARLDRLAAQTGGGHGIVVADIRAGRELYARHGGVVRTLASNTKLFITGAALNRWGKRIGPALTPILRLSDNIRAEALAVRLGDGSRRRGLNRAERFAARLGARVALRDGSGLATGNTTTPRQLVRFLVAMRRVPGHRIWERALPLAGRSGTLRHRLRGTAAEARCRAKTGTLFLRTFASTLSGYCRTRSGRAVAFSMLMATTPTNGRIVQDRLLARIAAR
jgi:D-alanyl-D-alanine carboxypeptidase